MGYYQGKGIEGWEGLQKCQGGEMWGNCLKDLGKLTAEDERKHLVAECSEDCLAEIAVLVQGSLNGDTLSENSARGQ